MSGAAPLPLLCFSFHAPASPGLISAQAAVDPRWFEAPTTSSSCQVVRSVGGSGCFAGPALLLPSLAIGRAASANNAPRAWMTMAQWPCSLLCRGSVDAAMEFGPQFCR